MLTVKATLFGMGGAGASRAIDILVEELVRVMTFTGAFGPAALTRELIRVPLGFACETLNSCYCK